MEATLNRIVAYAAVNALNGGIVLAYAKSTGGDVIGGLKSANPVEIDGRGNVVPLNKRFDRKSSDVRHSIKALTEDITEDKRVYIDYNDTNARDAAIQRKHDELVARGKYVEIGIDDAEAIAKYYPDLRTLKKQERRAELKKAQATLFGDLREYIRQELIDSGFAVELDAGGVIYVARAYNNLAEHAIPHRRKNHMLESIARTVIRAKDVITNAEYVYSPEHDAHSTGNPNVKNWDYFYSVIKKGEDTSNGVCIAVRNMAEVTDEYEHQLYSWQNKTALARLALPKYIRRLPVGAHRLLVIM